MKRTTDLASKIKLNWASILDAINLHLSVNKTHILLPNQELDADITGKRFDIILFDFPIIAEGSSFIHSTPIAVVSPVENVSEMSSQNEEIPLILYWLV